MSNQSIFFRIYIHVNIKIILILYIAYSFQENNQFNAIFHCHKSMTCRVKYCFCPFLMLWLPVVFLQTVQQHITILVKWLTFFILYRVVRLLISRHVTLQTVNAERVTAMLYFERTFCLSVSVCLSQSYCQALRRLRQQQILTGDTYSIKEVLQHPDVLWRAPCCLPGRSDAPPHTSAWHQRLFFTICMYRGTFRRYLLMFDGHGHTSPWRIITAAFHVLVH